LYQTIANSKPVDKRRRRIYYSGKKKRYTSVKNQIMVNNRGYMIHKANRHKKGKRHDYDAYKRSHPVTPKHVVNVIDLGYLGVKKDYPDQLYALPCKKRCQGELSQEEKEYKKIYPKKRIRVEHTICRLKKYRRIMSDIFKNKLRKYNKISDVVAGLVNYRITNKGR
jgi:hypothetical protein